MNKGILGNSETRENFEYRRKLSTFACRRRNEKVGIKYQNSKARRGEDDEYSVGASLLPPEVGVRTGRQDRATGEENDRLTATSQFSDAQVWPRPRFVNPSSRPRLTEYLAQWAQAEPGIFNQARRSGPGSHRMERSDVTLLIPSLAEAGLQEERT